MSTTLARKIRRIGLVRTPHTSIVITKDEQGNEVEATHTTYSLRRTQYPPEELAGIRDSIVKAWRNKRKGIR